MSYLTQGLRRGMGAKPYEEMKASLIGSGSNAVVASVPGNGGTSLSKAQMSDWQPLGALVLILFVSYYAFFSSR